MTSQDIAVPCLVWPLEMHLVRKTEFAAPGTFKPSMALCLAESLVETRICDPVDQLDR
jgi:hypothetical protein